ncbi:MAG: NAD(P)/FAD-dependent oxidoreductase [Thermodesulfobacteriota bacterium]|nr:NAD(P)/FAD-dependent oxidoreductase [Thermodesulfobacteriota bacterium]
MTRPEKEYDVIVIGGGINGLATAAYLQKAGMEVAVFERRDEVGTHCATEEVGMPGIKYNLHASGLMTLASPAYTELELEKFGLEMVTSGEWGYFHPFLDGTAVLFHQYDANAQYEAWKKINPHDAEVFRRLSQYFAPYWSDVIDKFFYDIPSQENLNLLIEVLGKCPEVPAGWENMDGLEAADLMFEDDRIKTALLTSGNLIDLRPWDKLTGPLGSIVMSFTMCFPGCYTARGGSHAIPHALVRCFMHHGGRVFQGCPVEKVIIENGEAKGVALSNRAVYPDAEIMARRAVISDLTPVPTFLNLVGEDKLPPEVVTAVKDYDYDQSVFTVYYVFSEFPEWIQAPDYPEINKAYSFDVGIENTQDLRRLGEDIEAHRLPDPPICAAGCFHGFSVADPTQAPPGMFPILLWANLPADPTEQGGFENWDELREGYGDKIDKVVAEHVTNFERAKVSRFLTTPLDNYRRNPSAILGAWGGGALKPEQFYLTRPYPGCGAPRTPVPGLYISQSLGAAAGNTGLLSGTIAARVVAEDLGIRNKDWWHVKAVESYVDFSNRKWGKWNPAVG